MPCGFSKSKTKIITNFEFGLKYKHRIVFKKLFEEKLANIQPNTILYTDGSFSNNTTSYAIVKQEETFSNIKSARLADHSGIFAAEISAIRNAIQLAPTTNL